MDRAEFLACAGRLQDFILDSIEEFAAGAGLTFDRKAFLAQSSTDFAQLAVEALFYGGNGYRIPEERAVA